MLPSKFSATSTYSDTQLDRARGYRLLVHAEIETYLEDRAQAVVNSAYTAWKVDSKPRHVITCLLAFCNKEPSVHQNSSDFI